MEIKVGDEVRYTGLSERDLTRGKVYEVCGVGIGRIKVLDDEGDLNSFWRNECEPVTGTPQAVPDYNNGDWWGWNGGECPVHGKSEVECEIGIRAKNKAEEFVWDYRGPSEIIAFRVTKPYVETKVETVTSYWCKKWGMRLGRPSWDTTHSITFNLIDGEPDPASIKMERLRD